MKAAPMASIAHRRRFGIGRILRSAPALYRALTLFAMLALGLQTYLVQTHLHLYAVAASLATTDHGTNAPTDDDRVHCPLCQVVLVAGAAIASDGLTMLLPEAATALQPMPPLRHAYAGAPAHAWQSRGPPRD